MLADSVARLTMHDSATPGPGNVPRDEKVDHVAQKADELVHEEELEPVVTPKTWLVVGVRWSDLKHVILC